MCHLFDKRKTDDEEQIDVVPKKRSLVSLRKNMVYNMDDTSSCPKGAALCQQQALATIKDSARAAAPQLSKVSGHPVLAKDKAQKYVMESAPQQNAHTDAHRPWCESKKYASASVLDAVQQNTTLQVSMNSHQILCRLSFLFAPVGACLLTTLHLTPGDAALWHYELVHCGAMYAKRNNRLHWVLSTLCVIFQEHGHYLVCANAADH